MAGAPLTKDDVLILRGALDEEINRVERAQRNASLPELVPVYEKRIEVLRALQVKLAA